VYFPSEPLELFCWRQSVGAGKLISMFHLLEKSSYAHFNEFIEIAGGDGQELNSLQKRIPFILGLFEDALVEGQPGLVAIEIVAGIIQADSSHRQRPPAKRHRTALWLIDCYRPAISFCYRRSSDSFSVSNFLPNWVRTYS
jgi:hypothetical protein